MKNSTVNLSLDRFSFVFRQLEEEKKYRYGWNEAISGKIMTNVRLISSETV